jgi:hypothetical protein
LSLAPLLLRLTNLWLRFSDADTDAVILHRAFGALAMLTQLRQLRVALTHQTTLSPASLRALHALTQLRELELCGSGIADDVGDADLASLVRALRHLRVLELDAGGDGLSADVLRGVARAGPQLRHINLPYADCCFAPMCDDDDNNNADDTNDNEACAQKPLFPNVETLIMSGFAHENDGEWR